MGILDRLGWKRDPASGTAQAGVHAGPAGFEIDLARVRRLATLVPGPLPVAMNGVRFAASIRPRRLVIEGGDDTPMTMPRTVWQLVYPDGTVMLDAGMDKATHDSFSPDKPEPYDAEAFASVIEALHQARLIVITHFHADHVAGVLTAPRSEELAGKSLITAATARALIETPHRPHLKQTPEQVAQFNIVDYDRYLAVAPGLVLIEAPGHSVDMQMAFVRLASGQEVLHSIDAAWNLDNIRQMRGKAAPWVQEDKGQVLAQLRFLNGLMRREPGIVVLVTHDNELFDEVTARGVVGSVMRT